MTVHFGMLTTNPIIDCALLAWFLAQLIKVVLDAVLLRKLDLSRFVSPQITSPYPIVSTINKNSCRGQRRGCR